MSLLDLFAPTPFYRTLAAASFRGVPFGVQSNEGQGGRRIAEHLYPKRDMSWSEDMGRAPRRFVVSGFLVSDSRVYGGGDVRAQRDAMLAAAEVQGAGTFVHPTLGVLQVACPSFHWTERWDEGLCFAIQFEFVEAGQRSFPQVTSNGPSAVAGASGGLTAAASTDFDRALASLTTV